MVATTTEERVAQPRNVRSRLDALLDPAGYEDGQNLYQYVRSNPLIYTDPSGLWPFGVTSLSNLLSFLGNPVHETIAAAAAKEAGWSDSDFLGGLKDGSVYPDSPDGLMKLKKLFDKEKEGKLSMQELEKWAKENGMETTFQSHFGNLQYWHGMAVPGKNCKENAQAIADWIVGQYQKALDAKNEKDRGTEIGRGLHTLMDTYALPHTAREWRKMPNGTELPMEITRFQDYTKQDPDKHKQGEWIDLDKAGTPNTRMNAAYGMAAYQSAQVLTMLKNKTSADQFRKWLTEGDFAPLNLSKLCECGGTEKEYAK